MDLFLPPEKYMFKKKTIELKIQEKNEQQQQNYRTAQQRS